MIREVHVYGQAVPVGDKKNEHSQHLGLGKKMIDRAKELAKIAGYEKLAVISAIGTREYYKKLGFDLGDLYQFIQL